MHLQKLPICPRVCYMFLGHTQRGQPSSGNRGKQTAAGTHRHKKLLNVDYRPSLTSAQYLHWEQALEHDEDRDFLLDGLREGFSLVDPDVDPASISPAETDNYKSATNDEVRSKVEQRILQEMAAGNYIISHDKPHIVSAISAIPKPNGDIRLIHDLSQPPNAGLNAYASVEHFRYETLQDALNVIGPDWHLAKVDLQSAYRAVGTHPSNYMLTGLKWTFSGDAKPTYLIDTRLPFGARKSPWIFTRLTQAVKRIMAKRGFDTVVVYLDDFLIACPTFEGCLLAYNTLITLLRHLGFHINWKKVVDPCRRLVFLGVTIDTSQGTISLGRDKVQQLADIILTFLHRTRASRKQLQSLAGKLSWAAAVIPWSRLHLRSIFDLISTLKSSNHKCRLSAIQDDLQWWLAYLFIGNETKLIWDMRPCTSVGTDASTIAGGAFYQGDWEYCAWHLDYPELADSHINIKELATVRNAALRWGASWRGRRVQVFSDNQVTVDIINKGTSPCKEALQLLRELSFLSLYHDFALHVCHIPGVDNNIPDAISRLHAPGQFNRFNKLLGKAYDADDLLGLFSTHMSKYALLFLLSQIRKPPVS